MSLEHIEKPALYVVATPIGNLTDLSSRAAKVLEETDLIAAEDTRVTAKLLNHLNIKGKELKSYHNFNEESQAVQLVERILREGISVTLVSDAGTPCISDPGYRLVNYAQKNGIRVIPVPGASAMTALVSASGLPSDRLLFVGFLPTKAKALSDEVQSWAHLRVSVVFFESARRLNKTLEVIAKAHTAAKVAIGRELTKIYEEVKQFDIQEALSWSREHTHLKGEMVIMICPGKNIFDPEELKNEIADEFKILRQSEPEISHKSLMKHFAGKGLPKKELYSFLGKLLDPEKSFYNK